MENWIEKEQPSKNDIKSLNEILKIPEYICSLLLQRKINSLEKAKQFFRPNLDLLHDPFLMKDMLKVVERIQFFKSKKIMILGDYDVDGTTSTAMLYKYFNSKGFNVSYYIPDRYQEGYGVSLESIEHAEKNNFSLIITVDCGIKAIEPVALANSKGIEVIICDHHLPGDKLPKAYGVINPKQSDCNYPFKELCGCGVGFKLIQALASKKGETIDDLVLYLDLVATAIGADIVPIIGENRILAYHGLQVINQNPRPGFKAIIKQIKKEILTITDVVFIIAPRINAAGRMKHGNHAVTLLCETDPDLAAQYANEIDTYNTDRRDTDKRITIEALDQIEEHKEQEGFTTVVYDENWHKGVIGIVASRLIETYYRPTLVFTKSSDVLAASARSVKGFDVYNALEQCSEFIEQFGGHKYAAGLTLKPENYKKFKAKFEQVVSKTIDPKLLIPEIKIDAQINLSDITPKFYRILSQFAPFGPNNMTPVFMTEDMQDIGYGKQVGEDKSHLRFTASQNGKGKIVGIGFGMGDQIELIKNKKSFKAAYTIDENEWNGNKNLQLKIKDLKA